MQVVNHGANVSTADSHVSEHVAGQVRTNWVGLIDEWATRFFHELDYEREAQNGMLFKEQMASLDGIVVADVYQHLSNKQVLTTVWVQGQSFCITHMWSGTESLSLHQACTALVVTLLDHCSPTTSPLVSCWCVMRTNDTPDVLESRLASCKTLTGLPASMPCDKGSFVSDQLYCECLLQTYKLTRNLIS